jgi:hypothetical protein
MIPEERFARLFDGLQRVRGSYKLGNSKREKDKVVGAAKTVKEPITEQHWLNHFAGVEGLGVVPIRDDQCCMFAAFDVDIYSTDLKKLNAKVLALYPCFVLCRTKSGGAHLYVFFSKPAVASLVRAKFVEIGPALGLATSTEIFPKQKDLKPTDIGNWINLPYYNTEGPTARYAYDQNNNAISTLDGFCDYAEGLKVTPEEFFDLDTYDSEVKFGDGPPCLEALHREGITPGNRNNALFNVGVYFRYKTSDFWKEELVKYNVEELRESVSKNEIVGIIKSLDKQKYFYKCNDQPICNHCKKELCVTKPYGVGKSETDDLQFRRLITPPLKIGKAVSVITGKEISDRELPIWITIKDTEEQLDQETITNQRKLRDWLFNKHLEWPTLMKPYDWDKFVRDLLVGAIHVEIPLSDTETGRLYGMLEDFCMIHGRAYTREDVDQNRVWKDDETGMLIFRKTTFLGLMEMRGYIRKGAEKTSDLRRCYKRLREDFGVKDKQFKPDPRINKTAPCWTVSESIFREPAEPPVRRPQTEF